MRCPVPSAPREPAARPPVNLSFQVTYCSVRLTLSLTPLVFADFLSARSGDTELCLSETKPLIKSLMACLWAPRGLLMHKGEAPPRELEPALEFF